MPRIRLIALAAAVLCCGPQAVRADNALAGAWTIVRADPAPWSDAKSYPPDRQGVSVYIGKPIVFASDRIDGPDLLACSKPDYRMVDVPAAGLFQGQLGELEQRGGKKAEDSATAVGFATRPIKTLMTDCPDSIDYHMSDANHAAFALNNMLYWLKRDGTPGG